MNAHYTDPAIAESIWSAVRDFGFDPTGATVLEPGVGSGNFLASAPAGARYIGVELDPTTAAITQHLFPDAEIRAQSFSDTRMPTGDVDLVVGNVPFGDYVLHDTVHNKARYTVHNHFLVKSLDLVRPGGLLVAITSRYTLDSVNDQHRRDLAAMGDLLTAVRLPAGAHHHAGTQAVTDLLVFRKRDPEQGPGADPEWLRTGRLTIGSETHDVNELFLGSHAPVLGEWAQAHHGLYRANELTVQHDGITQIADDLRGALRRVADRLPSEHRYVRRRRVSAEVDRGTLETSDRPESYLRANADGSFSRTVDGQWAPHPVPRSQQSELTALLRLRDDTLALLAEESRLTANPETMATLRAQLNADYDRYVEKFGPINRFAWRRTGRTDPETGEDKLARIRPPQGKVRVDPYAPVVFGLEHFSDATMTADKADIFAKRVLVPREVPTRADSPADALGIVLDQHGRVDTGEVAALLDISRAEARQALVRDELAFEDPERDGVLVSRAEYLSGDVRSKLAIADAAAAANPDLWRGNVTALRSVVPKDLGPGEIRAALGAVWIPASDVRDFLVELLDDPTVKIERVDMRWQVSGRADTALATTQWGTGRRNALELAQNALEQRTEIVRDTVEGTDGSKRSVLNMGDTVAAQEKATLMKERFAEWVWEKPDRSERLVTEYNKRFNSLVLRTYDDANPALPGLVDGWEPRPHQVAAVARMIAEPAVLLAHEVGAGKTAEMVIGVMEQRRLGLITKAAVIVPNNMLAQFSREWQQLYPAARVLMATRDDLAKTKRREFLGRVATGDWDAVVMTRSAFERIPMSREAQQRYLDAETEKLRAQKDRVSDKRLVKRIESAIARAEERIQRQIDAVGDDGVTFEMSGIDYLVVDEAHGYKNLRTASEIPGASIDGSNRAGDLDMKLAYLREKNADGRVATFATATPIANSITEAHVMQRYLRPDLLENAGLETFDAWAATFGRTVSAIELSPDGSSFRMNTRFSQFVNVPELLRMWHVSADVKTAADLNLPVPVLRERDADQVRTPEIVSVEPSPELEDYISDLVGRAERLKNGAVDPREDNMLKVTGDGRSAALDLRLRGGSTGHTTKLDVAAERIAAIHHRSADNQYLTTAGTPHPTTGSLQIVFCDLGTPSADPSQWTAYGQLRENLIACGVPAERIAYVHDAANDEAKGRLFQACRDGQINVLIGSTEKMGVGTNVQQRAIALHHLDCPWRPADVQQREGRIIRQGNQNPEVEVLRYVTTGSFDAYSWQTVSRKAVFIAQVMRGRLDVREIEDIGEAALSFDEVKAITSGRPEVIEHAEAKAELTRLERLERGHDQQQGKLDRDIADARRRLPILATELDIAHQAVDALQDTRADLFVMTTPAGGRYVDRPEAGAQILSAIDKVVERARNHGDADSRNVFTLGGLHHHVSAHHSPLGTQVTITIGDTAARNDLQPKDFATITPGGLVSRLENRLRDLPLHVTRTEHEIEDLQQRIEQSSTLLGAPSPYTDRLRAARANFDRLETLLATEAEAHERAAAAEADELPAPTGSAEGAKTRTGEIAGRSESSAPVPAASQRFNRGLTPTEDQRARPTGGNGAQPYGQRSARVGNDLQR